MQASFCGLVDDMVVVSVFEFDDLALHYKLINCKINQMSGYIDNSKFRRMITNRPALSLIPSARPKVFAQYLGMNWFISLSFIAVAGIFFFHLNERLKLPVEPTKTTKKFAFESDPYSGKVHCTYKSIPYKQ